MITVKYKEKKQNSLVSLYLVGKAWYNVQGKLCFPCKSNAKENPRGGFSSAFAGEEEQELLYMVMCEENFVFLASRMPKKIPERDFLQHSQARKSRNCHTGYVQGKRVSLGGTIWAKVLQ